MDPLSPLDGRYSKLCQELSDCIGQDALLRFMYAAELEWLLYLTQVLPEFEELKRDTFYEPMHVSIPAEIREIEAETGHEIKAVERYLRKKLKRLGHSKYAELVHFGLTSEDITNIAYASAIRRSLQVMETTLTQLAQDLGTKALMYADTAMLARTHGQPASPTTVGKEFRNYERRLAKQIDSLNSVDIAVKLNGASGNYNALYAAYPDIDWIDTTRSFIRNVCGFEPNLHTTQVEPGDWLAEVLHALSRINTILVDLSCDMWQYISLGYFKLKVDRVGSSTMPHKINPIEFENAEGNFGIANALLTFMASKLPVSRMQRDLSGSTVKRNLGVAFGHSYVGYRSVLSGLQKLNADHIAISCDLSSRYEVLAEAYQTVLRRYGFPDAYEEVRKIFTGANCPSNWSTDVETQLHNLIEKLDIPSAEKRRLFQMSPSAYVGMAEHLAARR